jgi:hypothetical protein
MNKGFTGEEGQVERGKGEREGGGTRDETAEKRK